MHLKISPYICEIYLDGLREGLHGSVLTVCSSGSLCFNIYSISAVLPFSSVSGEWWSDGDRHPPRRSSALSLWPRFSGLWPWSGHLCQCDGTTLEHTRTAMCWSVSWFMCNVKVNFIDLHFAYFSIFFSCVLWRVDSQRDSGPDTVSTSRICQQPQQRKQPQLPLVNRGQRGTSTPLAFWEDRIWWKWW